MTGTVLAPGAVIEVSTVHGPAYVVFVRPVQDEGDLVLVLPIEAVSDLNGAAFQAALADAYPVFMSIADILKLDLGRSVARIQLDRTDVPLMRYREQLGDKRRWRLWSDQGYGKPLRKLKGDQVLLPVKQWVNPDMLGMMLAVGYRPQFDLEGPDAIVRLAERRGIDLNLDADSKTELPRHFLYFNTLQAAQAAQARLNGQLDTEVVTVTPSEHALIVRADKEQVDWLSFAQATGGDYDGFERAAN